jgi:MFS family permease
MIPDPADIIRRRITATLVFRVVAILVALAALVPILIWLAVGIVEKSLWRADSYTPAFVVASILFAVATAIWFLAPVSARFALPVPRVLKCPACLYRLQGVNAPQCPECGLTLTPEFLNPERGRPPRRAGPDTILLRRLAVPLVRGPARRAGPDTILLRQIMLLTVRVIALAAGIPSLLYLFIATSIWLSNMPYESPLIALPPLLMLALLTTLFALAPTLAILAVPDRPDCEAMVPARRAAAFLASLLGLATAVSAVWLLAEGPPHPVEIALFVIGVAGFTACFPLARAKMPRPGPAPPEPGTTA